MRSSRQRLTGNVGLASTGRCAAANAGFTLVELVTVVTIVGVLAMLAGPSFSKLIADQRAGSAATDMYVALATTRSEAIKRNTKITLRPKTGGWAKGWEVVDPADTSITLLEHGELSGAAVAVTPTTMTSVIYLSSGRVQASAAPSFTITTSAGSTTSIKTLCVDLTGRPYVNSTSCS